MVFIVCYFGVYYCVVYFRYYGMDVCEVDVYQIWMGDQFGDILYCVFQDVVCCVECVEQGNFMIQDFQQFVVWDGDQ